MKGRQAQQQMNLMTSRWRTWLGWSKRFKVMIQRMSSFEIIQDSTWFMASFMDWGRGKLTTEAVGDGWWFRKAFVAKVNWLVWWLMWAFSQQDTHQPPVFVRIVVWLALRDRFLPACPGVILNSFINEMIHTSYFRVLWVSFLCPVSLSDEIDGFPWKAWLKIFTGILCLAALVKNSLNLLTPDEHFVGLGSFSRRDSNSDCSRPNLARLRLMKVLAVRGGGWSSMNVMQIGRWSELRDTLVSHTTEKAKWAEIMEMSGDEVVPLEGIWFESSSSK
jgi:hypothetical protein